MLLRLEYVHKSFIHLRVMVGVGADCYLRQPESWHQKTSLGEVGLDCSKLSMGACGRLQLCPTCEKEKLKEW